MQVLRQRVRRYRLQSVAPSTRRLRRYQWRAYKEFCSDYGINVFPATPEKISMYVSVLALSMKPSSIVAYLQGIVFKHVVLGLEPPSMSHPHIKSTLAGVKNDVGLDSCQKDPILPQHLRLMSLHVDTSDHIMMLTWMGCLLMFRCLLRVGQVMLSPHTLTKDAVIFTEYGFKLLVYSSKTSSRRDPPAVLPVSVMSNKRICVVYWLKKFLLKYPGFPNDPLFSTPVCRGLSYSTFSLKFNQLLLDASIKGNFSSHSLRRGGASCMSQSGMSVADVKARGRWRSSCVYKYIKTSEEYQVNRDVKWVKKMNSSSGLAALEDK